jgi:predicted phage replisome organizer
VSDKQKRRYYWLKLKENFFEEDTIEWLEEQPNGKEYCLFYLKLCLKSLKTEGLLVRNVGNLMIPYDPESLAKLTNSKADTVKVAMDLFNKIGLIEIMDSGEIYLNQLGEMVGTETESARQKRLQRSKEDYVRTLSGKGRLELEKEIE